MIFHQTNKPAGRIFLVLVALLLVLAACGDTDDNDDNTTGDDDSNVYVGEHGLVVKPTFNPDPPQSGEVELTLELTVDGDPLEGAEVSVEPWMTAHGHGSNTDPVVVEKDNGIYRVEDLIFSMPGVWDLKVNVEWNELQIELVWEVEVGG